jgi:hypothetical protein
MNELTPDHRVQRRHPIMHPQQPVRPGCQSTRMGRQAERVEPSSIGPRAILPRSSQGRPARLCFGSPLFELVYPTSPQGGRCAWFHPSCKSAELSCTSADCQVHKLYIVVELLTSEIPDRAMFRRPVLKTALAPYFQLVQGESGYQHPLIHF